MQARAVEWLQGHGRGLGAHGARRQRLRARAGHRARNLQRGAAEHVRRDAVPRQLPAVAAPDEGRPAPRAGGPGGPADGQPGTAPDRLGGGLSRGRLPGPLAVAGLAGHVHRRLRVLVPGLGGRGDAGRRPGPLRVVLLSRRPRGARRPGVSGRIGPDALRHARCRAPVMSSATCTSRRRTPRTCRSAATGRPAPITGARRCTCSAFTTTRWCWTASAGASRARRSRC